MQHEISTECERRIGRLEHTLYDADTGLSSNFQEFREEYYSFKGKVLSLVNKAIGGLAVIGIVWSIVEIILKIHGKL